MNTQGMSDMQTSKYFFRKQWICSSLDWMKPSFSLSRTLLEEKLGVLPLVITFSIPILYRRHTLASKIVWHFFPGKGATLGDCQYPKMAKSKVQICVSLETYWEIYKLRGANVVNGCFNMFQTHWYKSLHGIQYRFLHQNQLKNLSLPHISRLVGPYKQWTRGWDCTPMTLSKFQMSLDHPWKHIIFISSTMKTCSNQTWCIKCQVQLPDFLRAIPFRKKSNLKVDIWMPQWICRWGQFFVASALFTCLPIISKRSETTSSWNFLPKKDKQKGQVALIRILSHKIHSSMALLPCLTRHRNLPMELEPLGPKNHALRRWNLASRCQQRPPFGG